MSSIGRIFIVLNLILSAAFLGWAANTVATNQDYKAQFLAEQDARTADVEDLEGQRDMQRSRADELENSRASTREERDLSIARAESLDGQLAEAKRENDQLRGEVTTISETLSGFNDTISTVSAAKDRAVADARQMERERDGARDDQLAAELAEATAEEGLTDARATIVQMEMKLNETSLDLSRTQTKLATLVDMTGVTLDQLISQPLINASVLSVKNDLAPGLVALNVGQSSGVKRGMTFEIYRDSVYKGQVRVQSVRPEMCSALVVRTVDGTSMSQGDQASTRL